MGLRTVAVFVLLFALAFGLRLPTLQSQSFDNDEIFSMRAVQAESVEEMLAGSVALIDHPPAYFLVLRGWTMAVGESEFAVRFLSVAFGLATAALIASALRTAGGSLFGAIGMGVAAISPFLIYFAQEARMYALAGAAVALALLAAARLLRDRSWPNVALFGMAALLALYSDLTAAVPVAALGLALLARFRTDRAIFSGLVLAGVGSGLLFLPWALFKPLLTGVYDGAAGATPWLDAAGSALVALVAGITLQNTLGTILALTAIGLLIPTLQLKSWSSPLRWILPITLALSVIAILIISQTGLGFAPRHIYAVAPIAIAWFGASIAGAYRAWPGLSVVGLVVVVPMAISTVNYFVDPFEQRPDFRAAAAYLDGQLRDGDRILYNAPWSREPLSYYLKSQPISEGVPSPVAAHEAETTAQLERLAGEDGRLWLIQWQDWVSDPSNLVRLWLGDHAARIGGRVLPYVTVLGFETGNPVLDSSPAEFDRPIGTTLGDLGRLIGANVDDTEIATKGRIYLTLYWESLNPTDTDYKVFTQLLDEQNRVWAQKDNAPVFDSLPTSRWRPGWIIRDSYELRLQPAMPPGEYRLITGFYDPRTGTRLDRTDGAGDFVTVESFSLQKSDLPISASRMIGVRSGAMELVGVSFPGVPGWPEQPMRVRPGGAVFVNLFWRRVEESPLPNEVELSLINGGQTPSALMRAPINLGLYAPADWAIGEIVADRQRLIAPPEIAPGEYRLIVTTIGDASNRQSTEIATVAVVP